MIRRCIKSAQDKYFLFRNISLVVLCAVSISFFVLAAHAGNLLKNYDRQNYASKANLIILIIFLNTIEIN
jgi:hypothetical protein